MIRFTLRCASGHDFDSWFQSGDAFEALRAAGHLTCAVCNSNAVDKSIMAPRINAGAQKSPAPDMAERPLSQPASPAEQALMELRKRIEATSDDVGGDFAKEARRIHAGEAPPRPIYGEATLPEAKSLHEEGVPVTPLPWSTRKTN